MKRKEAETMVKSLQKAMKVEYPDDRLDIYAYSGILEAVVVSMLSDPTKYNAIQWQEVLQNKIKTILEAAPTHNDLVNTDVQDLAMVSHHD